MRFWKEYFTFNKTERRGIRFLLIVILLQLVGIYMIPYVLPDRKTDYSQFDAEVKRFLASADSMEIEKEKKYSGYTPRNTYTKTSVPTTILHPFDPNGLPAAEWMAMGLSQKQADAVKNYEAKGGKFYKKEDLKKLFVISEAFYTKVEPYIQIDTEKMTFSTDKGSPVVQPLVELNAATPEALQNINGIGEKLSQRIIAYKERLGGFYAIEQLQEVYGLSEENYQKISKQLYVSEATQKINLNYCDIKELGRHPYIGYDKAREIIDYRNKNGFFKNTGQLLSAGLADEALYLKLAHYIIVQ